MLVQIVRDYEAVAEKQQRIPWTDIAKAMKTKKHPEQLRMRMRCLKRRFGESAANFPRRFFMKTVEEKATTSKRAKKKNVEEELSVWRQSLQVAYAEIRRDQKENDKLVLGHAHMYGELIPSRLIKIFEIFKKNCDFNSNSVFVDFGCGLGKVVYMAYKSKIRESIGIEEEKKHLDVMRKSMVNLHASSVKIIEGLVEDHLCEVLHATHVYSFDWVFSIETMKAIYGFFKKRRGIYWASFQRPKDLTEQDLKFQLIEEVDGKMSRSTESHKCYVYKIL